MIEQDIQQQLITAGIDLAANIVLGTLPSTPDNLIALTTSSSVLTSTQNALTNQAAIPPGISDIQETISITVRNASYSIGQDKAWQIYNLLAGKESGYVVCNGRQMFVLPVQTPYFLEMDGTRNCFTFNIVVNTSRDT